MNSLKCSLIGLLVSWTALSCLAQMPFHLKSGAGSVRLGVICGEESRWLDQCKVKTKGTIITGKDALLQGGEIVVKVCPLTHTDGFVMEVEAKNVPEGAQLCWAFGACNEDFVAKGEEILPAACRHNVFSIEGHAFAAYYGESMALRVTQGITPPGATVRLCDARRQGTPLGLYRSGKKTDAPVIASLCSLKAGEKLYFCFYKQNAKADYNYFMLPELFAKEQRK